ncbi:MAG: DUF3237 family protein [Rhodobacteraceae bacterium]|nr:DUF3237 family protein [Paracoccaceae bacterium]
MTYRCTFPVLVGSPINLGDDGFGMARIVPILGGNVEGPSLSGEILPGGADEQHIRADGFSSCRLFLQLGQTFHQTE